MRLGQALVGQPDVNWTGCYLQRLSYPTQYDHFYILLHKNERVYGVPMVP